MAREDVEPAGVFVGGASLYWLGVKIKMCKEIKISNRKVQT
jgi:hypothetical protein